MRYKFPIQTAIWKSVCETDATAEKCCENEKKKKQNGPNVKKTPIQLYIHNIICPILDIGHNLLFVFEQIINFWIRWRFLQIVRTRPLPNRSCDPNNFHSKCLHYVSLSKSFGLVRPMCRQNIRSNPDRAVAMRVCRKWYDHQGKS